MSHATSIKLILAVRKWAIAALLWTALVFPAQAQFHQTAMSRLHAQNCFSLNNFTTLVALTTLLFDPNQNHPAPDVSLMSRLMNGMDRYRVYKLLRDNNHNHDVTEATFFLHELSEYLDAVSVNDTWKQEKLIRSPMFQQYTATMVEAVNSICDASATDRITGQDYSGQSYVDRQSVWAKTKSNLSPIGAGLSNRTGINLNYSVAKETKRLINVFAILLGILSSLIILNYAYRFAVALRLDRYTCNIPAKAYVGPLEVSGVINIVSRYGLSFEPERIDDPRLLGIFQIGEEVSFKIGTDRIRTRQTIAFDGSAGFKITTLVSKDLLLRILAHSTTYPYRRIERRHKRKPATPSQASLVQ